MFLVSFITVFIAISFNHFIANLKDKKIAPATGCLAAILITLSIGFILSRIDWTKPYGKANSVSIVQGNFPQMQKWDPMALQTIMTDYYQMTASHPAQLVFWPENAIPTFKPYIEGFLNQVNSLGEKQNSAVLVGTVDAHQNGQYFNAAFVYGKGHGHYYKHHLVPFGEYYPFAWFLKPFMHFFHIPMSSFTQGTAIQPLLNMNGIGVAVYICYESAYPLQVQRQLQNAALIAVISDDGWFGDSLAPWQHEEIAQMRAIETGRYVVQATNNGISSIINPKGKVIARLPQNVQAVLGGRITPMQGTTPWLKYGLYPMILLGIFFMLIAFFRENSCHRKYKPSNA